jgi:hypothetical protein
LVVLQNQRKDEDDVGHTLRSSVLFHLEVSRTEVFQSSLKTDGGTTWMVHMTSLQRSRGDEAEDR